MKKYTNIQEDKYFDQLKIEEDSYWTHEILHPHFWIDGKLDPNVREKLLIIAKNFYENTGFEAEIKDIQLTGSIANYNYHPLSDLDVHILIDFTEIDSDNPDIAKKAADGKRWIWNKQHDIFIRGNEVELYIQQYDEPHTASGLYSLSDDKWIVEPDYKEPQTDPRDVEMKAQSFKDEIDNLEKELDEIETNEEAKVIANRLAELRSKIIRMRRDAFAAGKDEFSVENLAFKELRNSSYMGKVIDLAAEAYDKMFAEPVKEGKGGWEKQKEWYGNPKLGYDSD